MGYRPSTTTAPSTRRAIQPTITQSYVADLFIECNDLCWPTDKIFQSHRFAYCRAPRGWHVAREYNGYVNTSSYLAFDDGKPFVDFEPLVISYIKWIVGSFEIDDPAERRRVESFGFINGVKRMLEHDPRVVVECFELKLAPRPCCEQLEYRT